MKGKNILKRRLARLTLIVLVMLSAMTSCSGGNQPAAANTQTGAVASGSLGLESRSLEKALASGKPTLADFGSTTCIPCKTMKAILEELDPQYGDKVNIVIVLVNDDANQEIIAHYQIMTIPTQIFFNATGKVVAGHVGAMEKEDIIAQFRKMGIE
jgi:thioredoxin 1